MKQCKLIKGADKVSFDHILIHTSSLNCGLSLHSIENNEQSWKIERKENQQGFGGGQIHLLLKINQRITNRHSLFSLKGWISFKLGILHSPGRSAKRQPLKSSLHLGGIAKRVRFGF